MAPSPAVFVQAVMDALGVKTHGELVDRLDWPANSTANVSRWLRDVSGPSYEPTIDLLAAAGWLTPAGLRALELEPRTEAEAVADAAAAAREAAERLGQGDAGTPRRASQGTQRGKR